VTPLPGLGHQEVTTAGTPDWLGRPIVTRSRNNRCRPRIGHRRLADRPRHRRPPDRSASMTADPPLKVRELHPAYGASLARVGEIPRQRLGGVFVLRSRASYREARRSSQRPATESIAIAGLVRRKRPQAGRQQRDRQQGRPVSHRQALNVWTCRWSFVRCAGHGSRAELLRSNRSSASRRRPQRRELVGVPKPEGLGHRDIHIE